MTFVYFIIEKLECQKLNIIGYLFSISYMPIHDLLEKKNKKQKDQNAFNMIASVYTRRCRSRSEERRVGKECVP